MKTTCVMLLNFVCIFVGTFSAQYALLELTRWRIKDAFLSGALDLGSAFSETFDETSKQEATKEVAEARQRIKKTRDRAFLVIGLVSLMIVSGATAAVLLIETEVAKHRHYMRR